MTDITVVIPSFRNIDSLERAIQSVTAQRIAKSIKMFVSIDHSENDEKIVDLLSKYQSYRLEYGLNNPSLGMARNWDHCIKCASTEIVALLHDDDYLLSSWSDAVEKMLSIQDRWDMVFFNHYFETDGIRNKSASAHFLHGERYRKLTSAEYYLGGYNYATIPSCGMLLKKNRYLETIGYSAADGYSCDERFVERCVRGGYSVLWCSTLASVYTFTTNTNLSSNKEVQRNFVLENIEHRKEIAKSSLARRIFLTMFDRCISKWQMGQWQKYLFPDFEELSLLTYTVYKIVVKGYRLLLKFTFHKI